MINYDEKRDFQRMPVDCKVDFSIEGQKEVFHGDGKDLSATGVTFISENELQPGTIININVHPFIKTVRPLSAKAEVIRCTKNDDGFMIGVKMEDVK